MGQCVHDPALNIMLTISVFHILFGHTDAIMAEMKRDEGQIEEAEEAGKPQTHILLMRVQTD